jgi:hypothetical protein
MNSIETYVCQDPSPQARWILPGQKECSKEIGPQQLRRLTLWLYDNEDIEGWLAEEGIGYFDRQDIFQYGISPDELDDADIPDNPWRREN